MFAVSTIPIFAQQTVAQFTAEATRQYPALAQKDSPLNHKFLELYNQAKQNEPALLEKSEWPLKIAAKAAASLAAAAKPPVDIPVPKEPIAQNPTKGEEPLASFKKLAASVPTERVAGSGYTVTDISFDVKKTDSLVNPMIGIVDLTTNTRLAADFTSSMRIELTFHWQENRWVFHQAHNKEKGNKYGRTDLGQPLSGWLILFR